MSSMAIAQASEATQCTMMALALRRWGMPLLVAVNRHDRSCCFRWRGLSHVRSKENGLMRKAMQSKCYCSMGSAGVDESS